MILGALDGPLADARDSSETMAACVVVIPCYNEEHRLDGGEFLGFLADHRDVHVLFVDDGSTDGTLHVLESIRVRRPESVSIHQLRRNEGKAEAVRHGLLAACARRPRYVAFWDADLATPLDAIPDFIAVLEARPELEMIFGARVQLLGRSIERHAARHYLGRVFATAASVALSLAIYDTQCGAKMFRVGNSFVERLREPFIGGWIFDVEIIAREIQARKGTSLPPVSQIIYEYPLTNWRDIRGSKIKLVDWFRVGAQLGRIYFRYLR